MHKKLGETASAPSDSPRRMAALTDPERTIADILSLRGVDASVMAFADECVSALAGDGGSSSNSGWRDRITEDASGRIVVRILNGRDGGHPDLPMHLAYDPRTELNEQGEGRSAELRELERSVAVACIQRLLAEVDVHKSVVANTDAVSEPDLKDLAETLGIPSRARFVMDKILHLRLRSSCAIVPMMRLMHAAVLPAARRLYAHDNVVRSLTVSGKQRLLRALDWFENWCKEGTGPIKNAKECERETIVEALAVLSRTELMLDEARDSRLDSQRLNAWSERRGL